SPDLRDSLPLNIIYAGISCISRVQSSGGSPDVHRGWTTQGIGKVDTLWALVWHFNADGKVDRVVNLSGDQHQMDAFVWANYDLAPIPDRLA
ncbi:hypothetical protein, partial [Nonomuraea dietziae]|uniref:hypothetical protein n=1 Tax=Nonomuraea dietziae TaxID=65515 RepID=UPI0033F7EFA1